MVYGIASEWSHPAGSPVSSSQQPENGSGYDRQHSGVAALPEVALFPRRTPADAGSGPDPSGQGSFPDPRLL